MYELSFLPPTKQLYLVTTQDSSAFASLGGKASESQRDDELHGFATNDYPTTIVVIFEMVLRFV